MLLKGVGAARGFLLLLPTYVFYTHVIRHKRTIPGPDLIFDLQTFGRPPVHPEMWLWD